MPPFRLAMSQYPGYRQMGLFFLIKPCVRFSCTRLVHDPSRQDMRRTPVCKKNRVQVLNFEFSPLPAFLYVGKNSPTRLA